MIGRCVRVALGICLVLMGRVYAEENWPQWRGPQETGADGEGDITASHLAWKLDKYGGPDVPTPAKYGR